MPPKHNRQGFQIQLKNKQINIHVATTVAFSPSELQISSGGLCSGEGVEGAMTGEAVSRRLRCSFWATGAP